MSVTIKPLMKNGYISNTLKAIQIGTKSVGDWIGEDLLIMENTTQNTFEYTVTAITKVVTYQINLSDMSKIPSHARDIMCNIAKTRKQVIILRTINLYNNL